MSLRSACLPGLLVATLAGCAPAPLSTIDGVNEVSEASRILADGLLSTLDESWTVTDSGYSSYYCWKFDDFADTWNRDNSTSLQLIRATSGFGEQSLGGDEPGEHPTVRAAREFAAALATVPELVVVTDPVGNIEAHLPNKQLSVTAGYDGDQWVFEILVSCATPGVDALAPLAPPAPPDIPGY